MGEEQDLNLTFSGCGFLGIYHLGVVSCLKENAPGLLRRVKCYGGASAGALAAAGLLLDMNLNESAEYVVRLAKRANSLTLGPLHPSFQIVRTIRRSLERSLPGNAHELASGRLHISLTRVSDLKNVIVSEFYSKEDLIEVGSCRAPLVNLAFGWRACNLLVLFSRLRSVSGWKVACTCCSPSCACLVCLIQQQKG